MSVSYFYPPGCETKNEQTCPQDKIDKICGKDDDGITLASIRAPFFKALPSTERRFDDKPGAGKCYNDYHDDAVGLRGWVRDPKNADPTTRLTINSYVPYTNSQHTQPPHWSKLAEIFNKLKGADFITSITALQSIVEILVPDVYFLETISSKRLQSAGSSKKTKKKMKKKPVMINTKKK